MKAAAFITVRNEEEIIPFTIAHYKELCDHIVILDNYSTDNTRQIALALGCQVESYGNPGFYDDHILAIVKNNCWKLRAISMSLDWAIVCDADEILRISRANLEYEYLRGTTILDTQGYNMHSRDWPTESLLEINSGVPSGQYSKRVCFNPRHISEINYGRGAHTCKPQGRIVWSEGAYPLLHYKFIGSPQRMIARHRENSARSSERNLKNNLSNHYHGDQSYLINQWDLWISQSEKVF